jgi:hypothetical protein
LEPFLLAPCHHNFVKINHEKSFSRGGLEMKSEYLKGCIGFAILLSVMFAVGCATTGPPLFGAKGYHPGLAPAGSTWVHERRDSGSFGSGTYLITTKSLGEQTWQGKKVYGYDSPEGTLLLDSATTKWVAILKGTTPIQINDPPLGWNFPLWVGKTYTEVYNFKFPNQTFTSEARWTVEAREWIKVPAGTFEVYRVTYSDTWNENISWWSPELGIFVKIKNQRNAKHGAGVGVRESELYSYNFKK